MMFKLGSVLATVAVLGSLAGSSVEVSAAQTTQHNHVSAKKTVKKTTHKKNVSKQVVKKAITRIAKEISKELFKVSITMNKPTIIPKIWKEKGFNDNRFSLISLYWLTRLCNVT